MKKLLPALIVLASCSSSGDGNDQAKTGNAQASASSTAQGSESRQPSRIGALTGLYEGGGQPRNQMCVVEGKGGEERFGLIVWGGYQQSCMGSGTITRSGGRIRLAMAGDSACTIEATISGKTVKLPSSVPQGCSYYCGSRASLGGAELIQQATTKEAAMRAKDIVGEPLCSGEGG